MEYIRSNFGSCCFFLVSKSAAFQNVCFSNIIPRYIDSTYEGGACIAAKDTSSVSTDCLNINCIKGNSKEFYASIGITRSTEESRNINQTDCIAFLSQGFVCGFRYALSKIDDKFILIQKSNGANVNWNDGLKKGSIVENIIFKNCSAGVGLIHLKLTDKENITMKAHIIKCCNGKIFDIIPTEINLIGWYSDKTLPNEIMNALTNEFDFPIKPALYCYDIFENENRAIKASQFVTILAIFLTTNLYKGTFCF